MRWPGSRDLVIAALLFATGTASAVASDTDAALGAALTLGYTAPLAFRRVAPLTAFAGVVAGVGASALLAAHLSQPTLPLAMAIAAYTLGHEVAMPASALALGVVLAGLCAAMLATGSKAGDLVFAVLNYGAPWLFGRVLRDRADRAVALRERAVLDERRRIARELHDVVAHALSVVSVQTQAVRRRLDGDHPREVADLRAIEGNVRDAMGEMRRLFGVLRAEGDGAPLAPQPRLADLDELLGEARTAGLQVKASVALGADPLPAGLDLTAYRIVQEALTNVRRHARAHGVDVDVRREPGALRIAVVDDGQGDAGGEPGHGLVGMRERAALYGGTLSAGSGADGRGFRVDARFPLDGARP